VAIIHNSLTIYSGPTDSYHPHSLHSIPRVVGLEPNGRSVVPVPSGVELFILLGIPIDYRYGLYISGPLVTLAFIQLYQVVLPITTFPTLPIVIRRYSRWFPTTAWWIPVILLIPVLILITITFIPIHYYLFVVQFVIRLDSDYLVFSQIILVWWRVDYYFRRILDSVTFR